MAKKLFISCPMKGRTEENIKVSIEQMHMIAEAVFGEKLEVIDSYIEGNVPKTKNQAIYYLGRSIEKMADADYFIGINYSDAFNGCRIENEVARRYGIRSFNLSLEVFPDALEIENHCWDMPVERKIADNG